MEPTEAATLIKRLEADNEALKARVGDIETATRKAEEQHARAMQEAGLRDKCVAKYASPSLAAQTKSKNFVNGVLLRGLNLTIDGGIAGDTWERGDGRPTMWVPGYLDDTKATDPVQVELQDLFGVRAMLLDVQRAKGNREPSTPFLDAKIRLVMEGAPEPVRKAFVDTNGVGGEWIPVNTIPGLERAAEMQFERELMGVFPVLNVERNVVIPLLVSGAVPYQHGVTGDDPARYTSSNVGTSSLTTALKTIAVRVQASEDDLEESIVTNSPAILLDSLGFSLATAIEDTTINGDTTSTHADTGLATWNPNNFYYAAPGGGSTDHRRAWIGLRHHAGDNSNTIDRGTFSYALWMADAATVVGPQAANTLVSVWSYKGFAYNVANLSQFSTRDVFPTPSNTEGANAIMTAAGMRIARSRMMTDNLNTAGICDMSTQTKTGSVIFNPQLWRFIRRYGARFQTIATDPNGVVNLVAKMRCSVQPIRTAELSTRYEYNLGY
jgi:hypothetical protein